VELLAALVELEVCELMFATSVPPVFGDILQIRGKADVRHRAGDAKQRKDEGGRRKDEFVPGALCLGLLGVLFDNGQTPGTMCKA
jgi:hypothetical protein